MRRTRDLPLTLILLVGLAWTGPRVAAASCLAAVQAPQPARSLHVATTAPSAFVIAEPSIVQTSRALDVTAAPAARSWVGTVAAIEAALSPASSMSDLSLVPQPGDKAYCPYWAPCSSTCPMRCDSGSR